jgi:hypothetical protein
VPTALKYPWSAYATLQAKAARSHQINDATSGTDDGLAYILTAIEEGTVPADPKELYRDIQTTVATGAWIDRNHTRLRLKYPSDLGREAGPDPEFSLMARQRLRQIQGNLAALDWSILYGLAAGYDYMEIAAITALTTGSLRTRVSRLRSSRLTRVA